MGDISDSDEELMKSLGGAFGGGFKTDVSMCRYCDTEGATLPCSMCGSVYYCDTVRI